MFKNKKLTRLEPFHATRPTYNDKFHHIFLDCSEGRKIKWADREQGEGDMPLCDKCKMRVVLEEINQN